MAIELIALVLLQQKTQIEPPRTSRPVSYSYSVEVSFYNPDWAFTLNFELLEKGLFQVPQEDKQVVRFEASKFRMRQRTAVLRDGSQSMLPDLSQKQFDEVSRADPSFITQFVLMPLIPWHVNLITQFRSELPQYMSLLGETFETLQLARTSSTANQVDLTKFSFQMKSLNSRRTTYTATIDRRSDRKGKTLFADVTLTDAIKNRVTLRIQRVPATP